MPHVSSGYRCKAHPCRWTSILPCFAVYHSFWFNGHELVSSSVLSHHCGSPLVCFLAAFITSLIFQLLFSSMAHKFQGAWKATMSRLILIFTYSRLFWILDHTQQCQIFHPCNHLLILVGNNKRTQLSYIDNVPPITNMKFVISKAT